MINKSGFVEWTITKGFKIFAGPALNLQLSNIKDSDSGEYKSNIAGTTFFESNIIGGRLYMWPGISGGIRF